MCGEVGDAPDGVALHLDVRGEHLADERLQSTELDDRDLVLRCAVALAPRSSNRTSGRTVDSQVAERSTRRALDLDIVRLEEKEDRLERFARDFSNILRFSLAPALLHTLHGQGTNLFRDLGKRESCAALEVDVVRVAEGREGAEGVAGEEVGFGAV